MKKYLVAPALASALALSVAGCAKAPDASSSSSTSTSTSTASSTGSAAASGGSFKACMVSDSGGFDDKSFNQTSHDGLVKAVSELGIQQGQVESNDTKDFAKNVQSMVQAKCNVIVTVGYLLADATVAAAKANPNIDFAIVDSQPTTTLKNLKPLIFNTAQSSFLGGYLAASMSQSGKVGTFGGSKIPTVTIFMDGFAQGVQYYNQQKGKSVQVLGWDATKQDGQFSSGGFEDVAAGKQTAQNLVTQGADVILPVAGPAGQGALQVAQASGGKVSTIWVDTDGYVSASQYKSVIMSSVYKGMDVAVEDAIKASKDGTFSSTPYVGTLKNQGTGLSPFHDYDSKVSSDVKSDLDKIKADIIAGKITITSKAQPK